MAITRFHYLNSLTLFKPVQNKDPLIFHYNVGFSVLKILRVKDQLLYIATAMNTYCTEMNLS